MRTRRTFGRLADLALVLASLGGTLIALDVGLRFTSLVTPRRGVMQPVPARHALNDWIDVFPPGYSGTLVSRDFSVRIRAGALGLREGDLDLPALAAQRPVLLLGDSYFFGWGVEQEERLSELLAQRLATAGHPVPVVNLSFPGWSTYHYVDVWRQFVPRLQPRLVVISLFVGNDLTDNMKQAGRAAADASTPVHAPGLGTRMTLAAREIIATSPVVSVVNHALWRLPRFRRLFNGLEVRNDRIAIYEATPSAQQAQLYGATEAALDVLARLSQHDGIPVLAVIIPDHLQVLMPEVFSDFDIDLPQRRLGAFMRDRGIEAIDLLPLFRRLESPGEMFFTEDKHWNAKGHQFVAATLHAHLHDVPLPGAPAPDGAETSDSQTDAPQRPSPAVRR